MHLCLKDRRASHRLGVAHLANPEQHKKLDSRIVIRYSVSHMVITRLTLMHVHNHNQCISSAIQIAERLCAARGIRFTPMRRKVLQFIWESHQAVKAYDLLDRIKASEKGATPMTIYRALQFLQDQGLIHRVETLNAYVGCSHVELQHEVLLLICDQCQQITERTAANVTSVMREEIAKSGFLPKRSTIEIYGTCGDCAGLRPAAH